MAREKSTTPANVKVVVAGGLLAMVLACAGPAVRADPAPVPGLAARGDPPAPEASPLVPEAVPVADAPVADPVEPRAEEPAAEVEARVAVHVPVGLERRDVDVDGAVTARRAPVRPDFVARTLTCEAAVGIARTVALRHGLEPGLVLGVMRVESGFVANIISYATAVGLMQVMPASGQQKGCGDLFDAEQNAECGSRILAAFLKYYKGSLALALSGYNAGHGMPDRARKEARTPRNFQYVEDVLRVRARWLRHGCREWE